MDKSTEIATLALVEARVNNDKKSFGLAYVFLFVLGWFGIHRFYIGPYWYGVIQFILGICGLSLVLVGWAKDATTWLQIGGTMYSINSIMLLVDLFLIPGQIKKHTAQLRERYSSELASSHPA